jgi:hypothetical protein
VLALRLGQLALGREGRAPFGELGEADDAGLVGFEQAAVGAVQLLDPGAQQPLGRTGAVLGGFGRHGGEVLELRPQALRVAEQPGDVLPDRAVERVGVDARPWASLGAGAAEGVGAGAAVVAPRAPPARAREHAAVDAQAAAAALEQAAQQVVVLLVAPEGQRGVARHLRLHAVPGLLLNERGHWHRDPLVARARAAADLLAGPSRPGPGARRRDVFVAVDVGGADVDGIRDDVVGDRRRPQGAAGTRHPRAVVQALDALADAEPLLGHPSIELAHHAGLRLIHDQAGRHGAAARFVGVAIRGLGADDVALARLLQLAAAEALTEHGALVLGDRALDLQQELVVRVVRNRALQEHDLDAGAAELLEQQDLVGVLAREAVGAEHRHDIDRAVVGGVAQGVETGPVEVGAAVALVAEDVLGDEGVPLLAGPGAQGGELAVDGLLAFLAFGGHPSVDGRAHGSSPGHRGGGVGLEARDGPDLAAARWRFGARGQQAAVDPVEPGLPVACSQHH